MALDLISIFIFEILKLLIFFPVFYLVVSSHFPKLITNINDNHFNKLKLVFTTNSLSDYALLLKQQTQRPVTSKETNNWDLPILPFDDSTFSTCINVLLLNSKKSLNKHITYRLSGKTVQTHFTVSFDSIGKVR